MPKTNLRSVDVGEHLTPRTPMTVLQAATSGSPRDLLVAQRNVIAAAVDDPDCAARDLAALTRRLQDIADKLTALDAIDRETTNHVEVKDGRFDAAAV